MQEAGASTNTHAINTPIVRWRWIVHLLLLGAYPVILGIVGGINQHPGSAPMLPTRIVPLLIALSVDFALFLIVFGVAVFFSRPRLRDLFLGWNEHVKPIVRGFVYSIALRGLLAVLTIALAIGAAVVLGGREKLDKVLTPEIENLVDPNALLENPLYLLVNLTLVSFVFAGFREELWRAGMLAGFNALSRGGLESRRVRWTAVGITALVFGVGHIPQGIGGVLMTALLGAGLGYIMVRRRSIWEAVFAHGFFNAASFAMLYLLVRFYPELLVR